MFCLGVEHQGSNIPQSNVSSPLPISMLTKPNSIWNRSDEWFAHCWEHLAGNAQEAFPFGAERRWLQRFSSFIHVSWITRGISFGFPSLMFCDMGVYVHDRMWPVIFHLMVHGWTQTKCLYFSVSEWRVRSNGLSLTSVKWLKPEAL